MAEGEMDFQTLLISYPTKERVSLHRAFERENSGLYHGGGRGLP